MNDGAQDVAAVVDARRRSFVESNAPGLKSLWAQDYPSLSYLATEQQDVFTTWEDIARYYDFACGILRTKDWRVWNLQVSLLSPTSAFARAQMQFLYDCLAPDHPPGLHLWRGRISFGFIRQDDHWKIVHYEDSTLLQWVLPLAQRFQRPLLDQAIELINDGDRGGALALLEKLKEEIAFPQLTSEKIALQK
ncbi:MAG: nuclear transport factor 2 family protein [Steroidobacteraceae bacterium]